MSTHYIICGTVPKSGLHQKLISWIYRIKTRGDVSFQLRQRTAGNIELFNAITLLFDTQRTLDVSGKHMQFSVGSVKDIEKALDCTH